MAGKALDSGKAFIDGILAKLPESLRESAKGIFTAPEASEALTLVGDGVLARADYSRSMDEIAQQEATLKSDYEKLNQWYATRQADFEIVDGLKKTGKWNEKGPVVDGAPPKPGDPPAVDPSKFVSRDDFDAVMRREQMAAAGFLALQQNLGLKHFQDFGEVLDSSELLQDPNLGKPKGDGSVYGLKDAYYTKFKDKITERNTKLENERFEKRANEIVAEKLKGMPQMQIPLKNGQGSPLDLLEGNAEFKPDPNLADTAAAEYARLTSLRSA